MPSEPAPRTAPPPRPEAAPARSAALRGRRAAASEPRQSRLSLRLIALLCHLCEVRQAIQSITCNTHGKHSGRGGDVARSDQMIYSPDEAQRHEIDRIAHLRVKAQLELAIRRSALHVQQARCSACRLRVARPRTKLHADEMLESALPIVELHRGRFVPQCRRVAPTLSVAQPRSCEMRAPASSFASRYREHFGEEADSPIASHTVEPLPEGRSPASTFQTSHRPFESMRNIHIPMIPSTLNLRAHSISNPRHCGLEALRSPARSGSHQARAVTMTSALVHAIGAS